MVRNEFTATGLVFNENGHILMIKHKKLRKWLLPGGHVEENELPCEAVVRTGLHNHIDLLYLCRALNVDTAQQETEIDSIGWFSPKEAVKLDTYEDVIKSIESALGFIKGGKYD